MVEECWRARRGTTVRLIAMAAVATALGAGLGGCTSSDSFSLPKIDDLNPFAQKQAPLPGTRIPIMKTTASAATNLAPANQPIVLPPPVANIDWSQPGGVPSNAPGHLALGAAPKQIWSVSAGTGSSKAGKVTASPIVYAGRVFTLDAGAGVQAFAANTGARLWRTSLIPSGEYGAGNQLFSLGSFSGGNARGGYGGGLAADNGRLYVATGYGTLSALDPASGKVLWSKNLKAPVRSSPTALADRVIVTTREGRVIACAGSDGTELWAASGLPEQASFIHSPSPAVAGEYVIAPFATGEVMALRIGTGETLWSESLTRARRGSAMAALNDAARPVIDRGTVFAVGHGGRMVAAQLETGERIWSANLSSTQPPAVVGGYAFVVTTGGQLRALERMGGKTVWSIRLPGAKTWSGPILAGNRLWLISSKGVLISVDAATGRLASNVNIGNRTYISPIVAGGRMYIFTDSARLIALR